MFDPKASHSEPTPELPVLPLRNLTLLPGLTLPVEVGRRSSLKMLESVVKQHPPTLLVAVQRDPHTEDPQPGDLHPIVVQAEVLKVVRTAILKGERRRRFEVVGTEPFLVARSLPAPELSGDSVETIALALTVKEAGQRLAQQIQVPESARAVLQLLEQTRDASLVSDLASALVELPLLERLSLLNQLDVKVRLHQVLAVLQRQAEVMSAKERIDKQVQNEFARRQREAVLRQQMKAIQDELGESDSDKDLSQFAERISQAEMPAEAEKIAKKQLDRLRNIPEGSPEASIQRTYLEWLCDLPWSKRTVDKHDLPAARAVLEADHWGLEKVKKRIVEYLAVRKLAPTKKGPILCLVGPPGVGKTSLGRSIAAALGRNFHRISLGGVRDEAEIRGHRRTYIGALPGRIVRAIGEAGSMNPVVLLDEIDMGTVDFRPNYDGSTEEPCQLPARLPFNLLNGASGIAVGLATEIPSHNLREIADACVALIKTPSLPDAELFVMVPGPDYPGGGQIISSATDIADAYRPWPVATGGDRAATRREQPACVGRN